MQKALPPHIFLVSHVKCTGHEIDVVKYANRKSNSTKFLPVSLRHHR